MATETPSQAQLAAAMGELLTRFQTFMRQQKDWLAGTPDGGPQGDGRYELTDYLGNTFLIECPAAQAARVDGEADSAASYASEAEASAANAVTHLTNAGIAREMAGQFASAAQASRDLAQTYADAAGSYAANALDYSNAAAISAAQAATGLDSLADSVAAAADSAVAAKASQDAAVGTAAAAASSATAAAGSATAASGSASAAATSKTGADSAKTAASTSATNAATSATNASNSATAAATSATNASNSATAASGSASAAATSKAGADSAKSDAAASATAAGNSATAAAGSATAASNSATAAAGSASAAAASAAKLANIDPAAYAPIDNLEGNWHITGKTNGVSRFLEIGTGRTADASTWIDLIGDATYSDYGLRVVRSGGANGGSDIISRGTGGFSLKTPDAASIYFNTAGVNRITVGSSGKIIGVQATEDPPDNSNTVQWLKVGSLTFSTSANCNLAFDLNGGGIGARRNTRDFVTVSGRGWTTSQLTAITQSFTEGVVDHIVLGTRDNLNGAPRIGIVPIMDANGTYVTGLDVYVRRDTYNHGMRIAPRNTSGGQWVYDRASNPALTAEPSGIFYATPKYVTFSTTGTDAYTKTEADARYAPAAGSVGDFNVNGNLWGVYQVQGASLKSLGDTTVGGTLAAAAVSIKASTSAANDNLWFLDETGKQRAVQFWNRSDDTLRIRKIDASGNANGDLTIANDGSVNVSATLNVTGGATFGGQMYESGQYPLLGFCQPGKPGGQEDAFIGSWNNTLIHRAWAGSANHSSWADLQVSQTAGMSLYTNNTPVFQVSPVGAVVSKGASAALGWEQRDNTGILWQWYSTGNRAYLWNNQSGGIFSVGTDGTGVMLAGGGGSMQIGDDTKLVDVNVAYTLGLQATGGGNSAMIQYGAGGPRIGASGGLGYIESGGTRGLGSGPAGSILHTGWLDMYAYQGNYNSLLRTGFYRINDTSVNSNFPTNVSYGMMLVNSGGGGDTTSQFALGYNTDTNNGFQAYYRGANGNGGTWHKWRALWDDDMLVVSSTDPGAVNGRIWIQI